MNASGGAETQAGWRILAIDDDPLFLEVVQVCLERSGCSVDTVTDPREGLNSAIEGGYDLVLLDLMMPGMAGEEILSLLKPLSLKQRIVVVSGRDVKEGTATARNLGAAGYIQKPVDTRQLTALLYDLVQDRIRDATVTEPPVPHTLSERLVHLVFGECEPTGGRKIGAAAILIGLGVVVGLLIGG